MNNSVIIVVPVYRQFTKEEKASFEQLIKILGKYPIDLLHPKSFAVDSIKKSVPSVTDTPMDDAWFKGRMEYNKLCLSPDFYRHYSEYSYMLIYQLDAWAFRDELLDWVKKGYDYVGAPWVPKDYYYKWYVERHARLVRNLFPRKLMNIPHYIRNFSAGNGGFSLRKIKTMITITEDDKDIIRKVIEHDMGEDEYISHIASRTHKLNIPDWKTALAFAFERAPKHCYRLNKNKLPFGCHSWDRTRRYAFWSQFIKL